MIIELIGIGIITICSFVIKKFVWLDKRVIYINKKDLLRFKDADTMVETDKEYFSI